MPALDAPLAILAQSGRMLAQSAVRAGWRPWVLDLYGDADTRALGERCVVVDDGLGGLDRERVLAELRCAAAEGVAGLVYGSGLECAPDWLEEIAAVLPVWGNSPETLRWLKSPSRFFALLDDLGLPYPESRFQLSCRGGGNRDATAFESPSLYPGIRGRGRSWLPRFALPQGKPPQSGKTKASREGRDEGNKKAVAFHLPHPNPLPMGEGAGSRPAEECGCPLCCPDGWLVKPGCGEGGKGVAFCAASAVQNEGYFQRHMAGTPMSALFLADGSRACLVGFNELWTTAASGQPFGFAGASNRPDLPPLWRRRLADWAGRLAGHVGLLGLNSLDFVFDGRRCWVLEVNPRPSATLALYDADFPEGLLAAHVRACGGVLPESVPPAPPRAMRIVYAPYSLRVPAGVAWPSWCADLPAAGSGIAAGQPLCSIAVAGAAQDLQRLSLERARMALDLCRPSCRCN